MTVYRWLKVTSIVSFLDEFLCATNNEYIQVHTHHIQCVIDCTVSGLMVRDDGLASKATQVNSKLRSLLGKDIDFVEHNNIEKGHLNVSRLHLNRRGTGRLAFNFIQCIENLRAKKQGS